jgi:hypothetical protein
MNNKELDNQIKLVNKLAQADLESLADYAEYIEQLKKTLVQCSESYSRVRTSSLGKTPNGN